ncbi:MAG: hypothetical protein ABJN22_12070 [Litorimonas sp.]
MRNSQDRDPIPRYDHMDKKELNKQWRLFIRNQSYFSKWKKESARGFWCHEGEVRKGIELQVNKTGGSYALVVHAGIQFDDPLLNENESHANYQNAGGVFSFHKRVDLKKGISKDLGGSWFMGRQEDLVSDLQDISSMLSSFVIPYFNNLNTAFDFTSRMEEFFEQPHLPIILKYKGIDEARLALSRELKDTDNFIIHAEMIDWLSERGVLSSSDISQLKDAIRPWADPSANWQTSADQFHADYQKIAISVAHNISKEAR